MNKKPIDKSKKSNRKCEHCGNWSDSARCLVSGDSKQYWHRCKTNFKWREDKQYTNKELETVFNMYLSQNGKMIIKTAKGNLVIEDKNSEEYPGVFISFEAADNTAGYSANRGKSIATIEFEPNKDTVQTVIHKDGRDDPTEVVEHVDIVAHWVKTDDLQFIKQLSYDEFITIEIVEIPDGTYSTTVYAIYFANYSDDEILKYLKPFGYDSVEDVQDKYGDAANQVIAECISECQGFNEDTQTFKSLSEVNDWLKTIDASLSVE